MSLVRLSVRNARLKLGKHWLICSDSLVGLCTTIFTTSRIHQTSAYSGNMVPAPIRSICLLSAHHIFENHSVNNPSHKYSLLVWSPDVKLLAPTQQASLSPSGAVYRQLAV